MDLLAGIAVSVRAYAIDKIYEYLLPDALAPLARPGMRVAVPFSRGNKRHEGVIIRIYTGVRTANTKVVEALLDTQPLLDMEQIQLAIWMKSHFFCTLFDAFRAILPAGFWFRTEEVCVLNDTSAQVNVDGDGLSPLLAYMTQRKSAVPYRELCAQFGEATVNAALKSGEIVLEAQAKPRVGIKTDRIAVLNVEPEDALEYAATKRRRAPQQAELLRLLADLGEASVKELSYFTGASMASFRALERLGFLRFRSQEVFRIPARPEASEKQIERLSSEQQTVFEALCTQMDLGKASAALLHGVTGSGKTAVYIRLIQRTLDLGKQAIVLVPEIALTPQLVAQFRRHFGDNIALLHSSLTMGERSDEWRRVKQGAANVVIGTRSAIFAPVSRLGLVVIDEEQESSYKSEVAPRYHAREVAKYLCVRSGALLLLSSATPSLESMYRARQGVYTYHRLQGRFNARALPRVLIVDLKRELADSASEIISHTLQQEIQKNLDAGEQTILFLNRRGTNQLVACPECGYMHRCPHCSVNLTYHAANHRLMCHYCGFSQRVSERCPECGAQMTFLGIGTQRVEAEIQTLFPGVPVLRMDADTINARQTHEKILSQFERARIPILIGTQMVSKGLNFENVTLVGVLAPDAALYSGDFRAQERTFCQITQVVGRAGRGVKPGRALIQTYTPKNEVLRFAAQQDYDAFYAREIQIRSMLHAPPVVDLLALTVSGTDENRVLACSRELAQALRNACADKQNIQILGPAPEAVVKANDRYRYRVYIGAKNNAWIRALIAGAIKTFSKDSRFKGISVWGDADPGN